MSENKELPANLFDGMEPEEELSLIQDLWYNEAAGYHDAGHTLRTDMNSIRRTKALDRRELHLEHSDALLDAWLDTSQRIGHATLSVIE